MSCPDCDAERARLAIPEPLREHAPGAAPAVVVCTGCLRTWAPAEAPDAPELDDPGAVSAAVPADSDAAAALLLAPSLLSSVVGNRAALEDLFEQAEAAGADPRLALERLADDPDLDPAVDVRRRLRLFEGLR